jgi:hypothetical protein
VEKIKNEDWGTVPAPGLSVPKKLDPVRTASGVKGGKGAEAHTVVAHADPYRNDFKLHTIRKIRTILSELRADSVQFTTLFTDNLVRMESLAQNVFKSEHNLVRSLTVQLAQWVEEEQRVEFTVRLSKFRLTLNKDFRNFVIEKPKPLFDIEAFDWENSL